MKKAFLAAGYSSQQADESVCNMNFNEDGELDYSEFV